VSYGGAALRRAALIIGTAGVLAAGPAAAADPILPLSQVRPGMVGVARTVVQGTTIVTFPVTVIDVQRRSSGPGGAMILIRADGPLMERTGGIAQGMSGSPVYVAGEDGVQRVVGALAFGAGDEANRIGGVTPIEAMLRSAGRTVSLEHTAAPRPAAVPRRRLVRVSSRAAARRAERRDGRVRALYPLTRWTISGASPRVVARLRRTLARSGTPLDSTGGRQRRAPVPLEPGASMTALLAAGDVVVGALGTVTYVDGPLVLGFGHPFLNTGPSRFLLGDGYVYETIAAPIQNGSYKLGEPGALHGVIVGDRADGLSARIAPATGVTVVSRARDLTRGTRATLTTLLAPDERTMPEVTDVLQLEPAFRVRDGIDGGTLHLTVEVRSPLFPEPIVYRNVYAAAGDVVNLSAGPLTRIVTILAQNGVRKIPIRAIRVEQVLRREVRAARIVGASFEPRRARPGQVVRLRLALQPWRGARRVVTVPVRAPALRPGPARIRVVPSDPSGFDPSPPRLGDEVDGEESTAARARRVLRSLDGVMAAASGTPEERVAAGLRRAAMDRHDAVRLLDPGESEADRTAGLRVPVPWVIYGGRATPRIVIR